MEGHRLKVAVVCPAALTHSPSAHPWSFISANNEHTLGFSSLRHGRQG